MPFGMVKLFEGQYQWKMPADVELDVGPARYGNLPKTWIEATEKYGNQDTVEVLANGPFKIDNNHIGVVFLAPSEPHKGFKILANVFFAHAPAIFGAGPENTSAICSSIASVTFRKIPSTSSIGRAAGIPRRDSRRMKIMLPVLGTPNGSRKKRRRRPATRPHWRSTLRVNFPELTSSMNPRTGICLETHALN
jgi:hypothetical protein